jgi:hypothetical protein
MIAMPLSILFIDALFTNREDAITIDALLILRLVRNPKVALSGLQSAVADAKAMSGSVRACGNGGKFCYAGTFNNNRLDSYHAFATAPNRSVVLRFLDHTVVVTHDKSDDVIRGINQLSEKSARTMDHYETESGSS